MTRLFFLIRAHAQNCNSLAAAQFKYDSYLHVCPIFACTINRLDYFTSLIKLILLCKLDFDIDYVEIHGDTFLSISLILFNDLTESIVMQKNKKPKRKLTVIIHLVE